MKSVSSLLQLILVVGSVALLTLLLEHVGWLQGFEGAALDAWLRAKLNLAPAVQSKQVVIVSITDQDYADIFRRRSPLDKTALEGIIIAIAAAKPLLLGIDIDTSEEEFKDLKYPEGIPIVWVEDASIDESNHSVKAISPALGNAKTASSLTGLALMPMESDGIVRSYIRKFHSHDSFAWVLARTYCAHVEQVRTTVSIDVEQKVLERCGVIRNMSNDTINEEQFALDLMGAGSRFQHVSARDLLDAYNWKRSETLDKLRGRAVLLGGTYHAGRDEYTTPVGRMAGVELVAHSLESELQGPFRRPRKTTMLVLNLLGGIGILLLFIRFGVRKGCIFSLLAMLVIAPLWSLIAFGSLSFFGYFGVILIALLIHQLYEQAHYVQHSFLHRLKAHKRPKPES
jgi:CHASE2 domain-containing sensor protein